MKTFDDGTEEEFLIFKLDFLKSAEDNELTPSTGTHGAKHLYTLLRRALNGNVEDEWIDIIENRAQTYVNFKQDVWTLTNLQIDEDAIRQQKKYLEMTKNQET